MGNTSSIPASRPTILLAKFGRWLILRDLDHDAPCAAALNARLCPDRVPSLCLRIAVRAVKSWFLADKPRLAEFLGIAAAHIPTSPDLLDDPKSTLMGLASRSRKRDIRVDFTPTDLSRREGPAYASRMIEFALYHWRPKAAAPNSQSLARCVAAIERLRRVR
jgi:hypothetical protein